MSSAFRRLWKICVTFICRRFVENMKTTDPDKSIIYVVMFDGASNVKLGGNIFQIHYLKLIVMSGVEQTISLFFNDVSKIPILN